LTFFQIAQQNLPRQPISGLEWAKSADSLSFVALALLNGVEYRNSDFKRFVCYDLATLCKNLVKFSPVTPEFKKGKDAHSLVDQQFGYVAPLLDLARISTEFLGVITTGFSFTVVYNRGCHCYAAWVTF